MRWNEFQERCILWESTTVKTLGMIMLVFGLVMFSPFICALYYGEDLLPFLIPSPVLLVLGTLLYLASGKSNYFRTVNGIVMLALAWVEMFLFCSIPFYLSGMSALDSIYEAVSGFTTTGMSVMGDLEQYASSLLMWRSMTQWIGGITIVVIFLYFLPSIGFGRGIFRNELSGSGSSSYTGRVTDAARSFILMYSALSFINFLLLILAGLEPFQSLCLALTTISTGGLMVVNSNMMGYSDAVQWITVVFMFLGGANFYLHYRAVVLREKHVYRKNSEFNAMILWFCAIAVTIILFTKGSEILTGSVDGSVYDSVKNTVFTVVSLGTTSGFYVEDFTLWPSQCTLLLMLVAIIGASSGSTSGGLKFSRLLIIYQYIKNGIRKILNPNAVYAVKIDRQSLDDDTVQSALVVSITYLLTTGIGAVALMILGFDMVDGFGLSIAAVSNGGTGFGGYGPFGDLSYLSSTVQVVLMILMWIGRMEIITALILFTPGFWKELWLNSHAFRSAKKRLAKD